MSEQIVNDLMNKCTDDVIAALKRTLSIAPEPTLPIAIAAWAAVCGVIGGMLEHMNGTRERGSNPNPDCVLLAALLIGRMGINPSTGISDAYRDFEVLKKASAP